MSRLSLELLKSHLRADDITGEDDYLQFLLSTGEAAVIKATNRTRQELEDLGGGELPDMLVQAVLMLCGHWYANRESVSAVQMHEVPCSIEALVKPFRKLSD